MQVIHCSYLLSSFCETVLTKTNQNFFLFVSIPMTTQVFKRPFYRAEAKVAWYYQHAETSKRHSQMMDG